MSKRRKFSKEKNDLDEKYFLLEEKRLTYSRWENQMYDILKWINEEKSARSHLKGLANKMAEELDQIRENTNPLLMIGSNSSSMTTAGMGLGHNTVRNIDCFLWTLVSINLSICHRRRVMSIRVSLLWSSRP